MKIDYTNLSFTQLIDKIEANRFFDLPRMVREAFRRLLTRVESLEDVSIESVTGDFVDNTDPSNPEINVNEVNLGQIINDRLSIKLTPSPNDEIVMLDSITGEAVTAFYSSFKPYKVYTALLTQSGTDAPVATVLENTLGEDVVWTRDDAGTYIINFNQTFTDVNKIFFNLGNSNVISDTIFSIERDSTSPILYTRIQSTATSTDSLLINTEIEIRVYN